MFQEAFEMARKMKRLREKEDKNKNVKKKKLASGGNRPCTYLAP